MATASEIHTVSSLRIFFVSLDKSVLLHRRFLMLKFTEMLILMFIQFYMNTWKFFKQLFLTAVLVFSKNLIFSIVTYYFMVGHIFAQSWLIWANFYFCSHCKVRTGRMFLQNSSQKCRSSCLQMFFRSSCPEVFSKHGVLRDFMKFTGKHLCQNPLLIKLQVKIGNFT